jgi:LCP family protein required for cell wall assembly
VPNQPTPPDFFFPPGASSVVNATGGPDISARKGIYTFLLVGINEGNTDTLMVATLDVELQTCGVLSIPRDTVVGASTRSNKKINAAYSQRSNTWDDEPGMPQLKKEVATIIGFRPQYSSVISYNAFIRLVNAVDGIDFDVPMRMYVPTEGIDLQKGPQHLNGDQALQLVRFRYNHSTLQGYDDYGRMRVQQQVLAATAKKALQNWGNMAEYIRIARENVTSDDIDWGNILWFADQLRKIGMDNVVFNTLPTYTVVNPNEISGMYYEVVKSEEALAIINETINPFTAPIGASLVSHTILTEKR